MLHDKWTILLQFFIINNKKKVITDAQQCTTKASYLWFMQSQVQKCLSRSHRV